MLSKSFLYIKYDVFSSSFDFFWSMVISISHYLYEFIYIINTFFFFFFGFCLITFFFFFFKATCTHFENLHFKNKILN